MDRVAAKLVEGKFEVLGVLGEGGTGIVYDARRVEGGARVALKVMHKNLAGDRQIRGRFQREAAILGRLQGPHICPILEFGEVGTGADGGEDGLLYIALPKLEGGSFEELLRREKPLSVDRGLDILLGVCAALESAHAQGVIHRDLKPANVILEARDGGEHVFVVDFGMAKIVTGGGTGTTNLTTHNMVFGTPEYMSPEQARGEELDARCDVYAVGIMLYELLTGAPPFTGSTPLAVLTAHLTSELTPPSATAPPGRVTRALEAVVLHALARDRDRRYPSVAALSAAIRHARAMPADDASVKPAAFSTMPSAALPFAATIPSGSLDASAGAPVVIRASRPAPSPAPGKGTSPDPGDAAGSGRWIAAWVVVALASIGLGIYLALR